MTKNIYQKFATKALQNVLKLVFSAWKYTIWQPWFEVYIHTLHCWSVHTLHCLSHACFATSCVSRCRAKNEIFEFERSLTKGNGTICILLFRKLWRFHTLPGAGLPDFSWRNIPKRENIQKTKLYQMTKLYAKWTQKYQMGAKYTNLLHSKALQKLTKVGFWLWKYTIWQPGRNCWYEQNFYFGVLRPVLKKIKLRRRPK
jgi:hypothetical protein